MLPKRATKGDLFVDSPPLLSLDRRLDCPANAYQWLRCIDLTVCIDGPELRTDPLGRIGPAVGQRHRDDVNPGLQP